jgi:hypothetical protein
MNNNTFRIWMYDMYSKNREERENWEQKSISFNEYYKNNMTWLKLKYKELKEKGN